MAVLSTFKIEDGRRLRCNSRKFTLELIVTSLRMFVREGPIHAIRMKIRFVDIARRRCIAVMLDRFAVVAAKSHWLCARSVVIYVM